MRVRNTRNISLAVIAIIALAAILITACSQDQPAPDEPLASADVATQPTATPTPTPTTPPAPTATATATPAPTATTPPTATATTPPTATATYTPAPTATTPPTPAPTNTPMPTATMTPAPTAAPMPTATPTPAPTATPMPAATATPTPIALNTIDGTGRKLLAIYMVGSDLEDNHQAGTKDLRELIEGYKALPDKREVEVVVAFGGAYKDGWQGMKFADMSQIVEDGENQEFGDEPDGSYLHHYPYADMDDEDSLKLFLDYIRDGYANFDLRFLTFWSHGNSYKAFGGDSSYGYPDPDHHYPLSMDEIQRAFERSQAGRFDLIGFDACLMASMEVAKVVEPHADYMIASEDLEPGHGWLWSEVIRLYAEESGIIEVGMGMVDNFVQDVHEYEDVGKTLSLLDLSQYDQLMAALNPVLLAYDRNLLSDSAYSNSIVYASTRARSYSGSKKYEEPPVSIDLMHFTQLLENTAPDADTNANLYELMDAIGQFVVHSAHDGSRPNSFGIAIDAPELEKERDYSDYKVSAYWLGLEQEYAGLLRNDTEAPTIVSEYPRVDAGSLQFDPSADAQSVEGTAGPLVAIEEDHLAEVAGMYGFVTPIESDGGAIEDYFMVVAELESYLTENENEYFVPEWDRYWFTVEYDPNQPTAWIPASFAGRYETGGQSYTEYTAEIDFYQSGASEPKLAMMTLVVSEYIVVVDHYIDTYKYEDGVIRFDKVKHRIASGNAIQFYNFGFNLEDESQDSWFPTGDGIVTFVQKPDIQDFQLEYLAFEDESGQVFDYEYGIWAEDASGNAILYGPFPTSPPVEDTSVNATQPDPTPASPPMTLYEDPWGYFAVEVPADWIAEDPDTATPEVLRASEPNGNGSVSIRAVDGTGLSLADYAAQVESWLNDNDAQDIALTYYEDLPQGWFEYVIENTANFWLFHVFDDGTVVDVIYTFPADLSEANRDLAYRSFDSFTADSQ